MVQYYFPSRDLMDRSWAAVLPVAPAFPRHCFGLAGGLGYERSRGRHAWLVELRYDHGLADLIEGDSGIRTRTTVLRAGFRW